MVSVTNIPLWSYHAEDATAAITGMHMAMLQYSFIYRHQTWILYNLHMSQNFLLMHSSPQRFKNLKTSLNLQDVQEQ